jgi:hypothetical protein
MICQSGSTLMGMFESQGKKTVLGFPIKISNTRLIHLPNSREESINILDYQLI